MSTNSDIPAELVFRALSDRTRVRLLNLLRRGEVCVCDLVDVLGVPQPTASRHLAYLRKAGLVVSRKDGQWCHYSLAPARTTFHKKLLECVESCCGEIPELTVEASMLAKRSCGPNCC